MPVFEPLALLNKGKSEPIRIEAKDTVTTMHLSGVIVSADPFGFGGIIGADFIKQLNDITTPDISIMLNSPGGSVYAAIAMAEAMNNHPSNITVNVTGIAASAATFLLMVANKTNISKMGNVMIHRASIMAMGNADELTETIALLEKIDGQIATAYADKTGQSISDLLKMMKKTTYFNAQEAVDIGFIDEITSWKPKNQIDWTLEDNVEKPKETVKNSEETLENTEITTEPEQITEQPIENQVDIEFLKRRLALRKRMAP